ncbi:MAG: ABC transporter substrate-binding protein [Plesiomonas sp.]|uniref:ABC transporter substrate-binding protein n=2 Tax=Plesiomonas sp. TaxID=2486279 RepID=UPI003EE57277
MKLQPVAAIHIYFGKLRRLKGNTIADNALSNSPRHEDRSVKKNWISATLLACSLWTTGVYADEVTPWQHTLQQAQGQTVYINTQAGNTELNNYLNWATTQVKQRFNITLIHTQTPNNTEIVSRIMADKIAGKKQPGVSDIVWLQGRYFNTLRSADLLQGPFVEDLPQWQQVDQSLPVKVDATFPTQGYEAPWGLSQLVFIYNTASLQTPPQGFKDLLTYAMQHPGKITYPVPTEIHGINFLKAALLQLAPTPDVLYRDVKESDFKYQTAALWQYLDTLHGYAWKKGQTFPQNQTEMQALLNQGEIDIALSFNPNEVQNAIAQNRLPETAKAYAFGQGAITRAHFLAIPFNAPSPEGAKVVINFLLSPTAQAYKEDPAVWGDPTILSLPALSETERAQFTAHSELYRVLPEPHPSWGNALETEWLRRYGTESVSTPAADTVVSSVVSSIESHSRLSVSVSPK